MFNRLNAKRIKTLVVAIISVMLMLVSTISFNVQAAGNSDTAKLLASYNISSSSYIVMSGSTSEVVIEKHSERKMQPGAVAMLLNAMVALDHIRSDEEYENVMDVTEKLASLGNTYVQGESIKVGDLLNAVLIGGDVQSADILAKYISGNRANFVKDMNIKVQELRLMDTQFDNPSGAYSPQQYTTAADAAVIMQAALRYEEIKEAFTESTTTVTAFTKENSRKIHLAASSPLLGVYKDGLGGIKSTLGEPANNSQYLAAAEKDAMQFIVVLMDSNETSIANEATKLLDYASTIATRDEVVQADKIAGYALVRGGEKIRVPAYTETKGFAYVPPEGSKELVETETVIFDGITAPLDAGSKVGEFRIYVADELKGTVDLVTKEKIEKGWPPSLIYISNTVSIVLASVLALALLLALRILYVKHKRKKMRELNRRLQIREMALRQMEIDEDRKRRNWTYGGNYEAEDFGPRTSDIRRETLGRDPDND